MERVGSMAGARAPPPFIMVDVVASALVVMCVAGAAEIRARGEAEEPRSCRRVERLRVSLKVQG